VLAQDIGNPCLGAEGESRKLPPDPSETCGKVERFQQTLKKWLRGRPARPAIGVGRTHTGTHVLVLVQDLDMRIINAATGELLRELVLNPTQRYQPTGRPPGPTPKKKNP